MHDDTPPARLGPVHHLAYVVTDLAAMARKWRDLAGVGPFLLLPHVRFDTFEIDGKPAVFDHSAAFAAYGSMFLELQLLHRVDPAPRLPQLRADYPGGLAHVAYVSEDRAAESARLEAMGMPRVVHARTGGLEIAMHDATDTLGFIIELHQRCTALTELFDRVRAAAEGWDGSDPLRALTF